MSEVGKCFSKVNRGQRKKSDFYQTPYSMTKALLKREYFDRGIEILEPACGKGAITKVLHDEGFKNIHSYDIAHNNGSDFLTETRGFHNLITNPPFGLANEFIMKAKEIIEFKSAFLLPLNYLQGQWRYENIYKNNSNFALTDVYIFTRMPMLDENVREDGKYKTGMQSYAWYIFKNLSYNRAISPAIKWINSSGQVVKK